MATNLTPQDRFTIIDSNACALLVRELLCAGKLTDDQAAICLAQDDEAQGIAFARVFEAKWVRLQEIIKKSKQLEGDHRVLELEAYHQSLPQDDWDMYCDFLGPQYILAQIYQEEEVMA